MGVVASLPGTSAVRHSRLAVIPVYWHLLSLDAPSVAVLWAWSLAHAVDVHASAASLAVLGIGTWLIYVADRLLDAIEPRRGGNLRERHFFHAQHKRVLLIAGAAACAPLLFLITRMPAADRREDAWIFAAVLVYSAAVHQRFLRIRFPRELAVGIVFACACAAPAWFRSGDLRLQLVSLAALFAGLCWLNCSAIHVWEHAQTDRHSWSRVSMMAVCIAAAVVVVILRMTTIEGVRAGVALLASDLLLLALDRDHHRNMKKKMHDASLSPFALRILADAALLTPLLLLIPWKL